MSGMSGACPIDPTTGWLEPAAFDRFGKGGEGTPAVAQALNALIRVSYHSSEVADSVARGGSPVDPLRLSGPRPVYDLGAYGRDRS